MSDTVTQASETTQRDARQECDCPADTRCVHFDGMTLIAHPIYRMSGYWVVCWCPFGALMGPRRQFNVLEDEDVTHYCDDQHESVWPDGSLESEHHDFRSYDSKAEALAAFEVANELMLAGYYDTRREELR